MPPDPPSWSRPANMLRSDFRLDPPLIKASEFALKVIDMNRPAPSLQLGLGTNYDVGSCTQRYFLSSPDTNSAKNQIKDSSTHLLQCSVLIFLQLRLMEAVDKLPMSHFVPKPQL